MHARIPKAVLPSAADDRYGVMLHYLSASGHELPLKRGVK
jgi:hypothetical protein